MADIEKRLHFHNVDDTIWTICFFIGLCIMIVTLFHFTLVIQHIHCIPKYGSYLLHPKIENKYSSLSVLCATVCVALTFISYLNGTYNSYPSCLIGECNYSGREILVYIHDIFNMDFYIAAKLYLYQLLIGRLFNRHYRRIYKYSKQIKHLLWMLFVLLIVIMLIFNIGSALQILNVLPFSISVYYFVGAVWLVIACIMSIVTVVLSIRPICCHRDRELLSQDLDLSILKKYCIISALQLIFSVSYCILFALRVYLKLFDNISAHRWSLVVMICGIVQMLDCVLLMRCIYIGFARKKTVCICVRCIYYVTTWNLRYLPICLIVF